MSYISFAELWGRSPRGTGSADRSPPDVGFAWGPRPHPNSVHESTNATTDGAGTTIEESDEQVPHESSSTSPGAERQPERQTRHAIIETESGGQILDGSTDRELSYERCEGGQEAEIDEHDNEDSDNDDSDSKNDDTDTDAATFSSRHQNRAVCTVYRIAVPAIEDDNGHEQGTGGRMVRPASIGCSERALMEGVALIIMDFVLLHCHLQKEKDLVAMTAGKQPKYMWNDIRNVIGAACVVFPMQIFRDCLTRQRTNGEVATLQERVGEALERTFTQEQNQHSLGDEVFTSHEFGTLFETMLYHNMRVTGMLEAPKPEMVWVRQMVTETLRRLKAQAAEEPLASPTWFSLSDRVKSQKLSSADVFLTAILPHLAERGQNERPELRLEQRAKALNPQDRDKFLTLGPLKLAVALAFGEVMHRDWAARAQTPSPLRSRRDSLAERKSKDMALLISKHNRKRTSIESRRP
ncbi:MAG: hypothetical protein Q9165_007207 [Trypethelium subeluteriae]